MLTSHSWARSPLARDESTRTGGVPFFTPHATVLTSESSLGAAAACATTARAERAAAGEAAFARMVAGNPNATVIGAGPFRDHFVTISCPPSSSRRARGRDSIARGRTCGRRRSHNLCKFNSGGRAARDFVQSFPKHTHTYRCTPLIVSVRQAWPSPSSDAPRGRDLRTGASRRGRTRRRPRWPP